jgi:hypothetical protein
MDLYNKRGRESRMRLEAEEKAAYKPKGIRESLYSHIKVSVRTMDIVILILSLLLIASIVIGITQS